MDLPQKQQKQVSTVAGTSTSTGLICFVQQGQEEQLKHEQQQQQQSERNEDIAEACTATINVAPVKSYDTSCDVVVHPVSTIRSDNNNNKNNIDNCHDEYSIASSVTNDTTIDVISLTTLEYDQLKSVELKKELDQRIRTDPSMFDWIQFALGNGIWYCNVETYDVYYSPAYKKLFGYEEHELVSKDFWQKIIHPDDLPVALASFTNHVTLGTIHSAIVRFIHKNGNIVWVRCHGKAMVDPITNKPTRVVGTHNDYTALMQVQQKLKEKEAILDMLTSTSLDGYWDWNLETNDLYLSTRFKAILGYTDDEISNCIESWWSLLIPEDVLKMKHAIERCKNELLNGHGGTDKDKQQQQKAVLNVVLRYRRKDGTIARMLAQGVAQSKACATTGNTYNASATTTTTANISSINNNVCVRMFGTYTDVSYLEEARIARDANAAKTVFLATMSHEIRTPLNAVLGMAEALRATQLTDEQNDCVSTLHNSGTHLLSLINDILDFTQIESGNITLLNSTMDIQRTIRGVLDVLSHSAQQKNVLLTFDTQIPAKSTFIGDTERIRQIVFNLVGNAVKFTSKGSVSVSIIPSSLMVDGNATAKGNTNHPSSAPPLLTKNSMELQLLQKVDDKKDGIYIIIKDTGCGIESSYIDTIFDDFYQAGMEIRSKYGGSGLGLSICKRLIEVMNGTISVQSTINKGSTFIVYIPNGQLVQSKQQQQSGINPPTCTTSTRITPVMSKVSPASSTRKEISSSSLSTLSFSNLELDSSEEQTKICINDDQTSNYTFNRSASGQHHKTQEKVICLLYEELIHDDRRGSVEGSLKGSGRLNEIHKVIDANDTFQKISKFKSDSIQSSSATSSPAASRVKMESAIPTTSFIVVVHQQRKQNINETSSGNAYVTSLLSKIHSLNMNVCFLPRIHILDIGRRCKISTLSEYESTYCTYSNLSAYPTSDEVFDELLRVSSPKHMTRAVYASDSPSNRSLDCDSVSYNTTPSSTFDDNHNNQYKMGRINMKRSMHDIVLQQQQKDFSTKKVKLNDTVTTVTPISEYLSTTATIAKDQDCTDTISRLHILVAEDNLINQKVMTKLLSQFPCTMDLASNGLEAIDRCKHTKYDLM
jgi:PAS domain S-box-containing protein